MASASSEGVASKYVATWQEGYRKGTREGMQWCIQTTMELEAKANTEAAKAALKHIAKVMQADLERRQPQLKDGESADQSPT